METLLLPVLMSARVVVVRVLLLDGVGLITECMV